MLGFPKAEHKQFRKNFLRTVSLQINYSSELSMDIIRGNNEKIVKLFERKFPVHHSTNESNIQLDLGNHKTPIIQSRENGLQLQTTDSQKILSINKTFLSYTVSGTLYNNFQEFLDDLTPISELFELCHIFEYNRISLRKINIVEFNYLNNPCKMLQSILRADLLGNLSYFPALESIVQDMKNIKFIKKPYQLNLNYGLNIPPMPPTIMTKIGQVTLDIDYLNCSRHSVDKYLADLLEINDDIFNVFSWAFKDEFFNLLMK